MGPSVTTANVSWQLPPEHNIEGSFEEMLSAAEKVLIGMKQSLWSGQHYPVLSFDDAEKMYMYLDDDNYPEGKKVFKILRNFLVATNSHVIISSTNVHRFLKDMKQRPKIIVIGDLSKENAEVFWEQYLPADNPSIPVSSPQFNDVYDVLGGHVSLQTVLLMWSPS